MTTDTTEAEDQKPLPGTLFGNLGEPIRLKDVQLVGVSATASQPGGQVSIYTKMALTSDDAMFYKIIGGMSGAIHSDTLAGRRTAAEPWPHGPQKITSA